MSVLVLHHPRPQNMDWASVTTLRTPASCTSPKRRNTLIQKGQAPRSKTLPFSRFFLRDNDNTSLSSTIFTTACPVKRSPFCTLMGNASDGSLNKNTYAQRKSIASCCLLSCRCAHFMMLATSSFLIHSFGRVTNLPALSTAFLEFCSDGCSNTLLQRHTQQLQCLCTVPTFTEVLTKRQAVLT